MRGLGTLVNVATVLTGAGIGLVAGRRLPERARSTVLAGIGLATVGIGLASFLETGNPTFPVVAVVAGGLLGELLRIEDRLQGLGERFRRSVTGRKETDDAGSRAMFVEGFVVATLTFCAGALTIVGSLQDGISGDSHLLIVKSALDGVAAVVFASVYGLGVAFAAVSVVVIQGTLTAVGAIAGDDLGPRTVAELEATGGLLILAVGLRLLEVKEIRVGSLLPALAVAPLLVALFAR